MAKLALLYKLESDKEEKLRADFLGAQQHWQSHQQKLNGLNQFRQEYFAQLTQKAQAGLSSAGFSHYQNFISKIDQAIEQQTQVVETAHRVTEQRQSQWRQQRVRTEAVAKLIEKEKLKQQAKLAKAEQKMLDEFATNQFYARRRSGETGM
ncbi:flagellar biosynthesis chaperone [Pseudoalteromonas sp. THAF3]|uniref:flagellar export protein FliJ n=1 Tax=Pseudoalteromonas TaxID=53246 RepID=UPI00102345CD|nr:MULTISPECIES: flagellar export protein FliJ [Pseudoalteromonas]MCF2863474.1 flagellar export protein FliJ [Pseudoalteromonas sp. CNAT2-18]MCG7558427.1 flagellar export protein FliJ [Pseudoalteromonas sp. CNAT2-18.1]MCG7567644.1 flagellar export protein FliJ [Pseudoalteromonas sp. CnMc7-15]MCG7570980.1 flagellar export protein FliJ [Pseudoalteromonas sp. CNC9-20]QFU05522.1 flagellar biosynthesis chaperone [Pseudoalteromonas sp. THAF3]